MMTLTKAIAVYVCCYDDSKAITVYVVMLTITTAITVYVCCYGDYNYGYNSLCLLLC